MTEKPFKYVNLSPSERKVDPTGILLEKTKALVEKVESEDVDCLVFLDKSARPLAYFFVNFWKKFVPKPLPKIKFINIGREGKVKNFSKHDRLLLQIFKDSLYAKSESPKVVLVDELEAKGNTRSSATSFFQDFFGIKEVEYFSYVDLQNLPKEKGEKYQMLVDIFPWFLKGQYEHLLVKPIMDVNDDGEIVEEYFTEPVEKDIDRTLGIDLRRNIKNYINSL
jgi:predicted HAD superfamily hydrolase